MNTSNNALTDFYIGGAFYVLAIILYIVLFPISAFLTPFFLILLFIGLIFNVLGYRNGNKIIIDERFTEKKKELLLNGNLILGVLHCCTMIFMLLFILNADTHWDYG